MKHNKIRRHSGFRYYFFNILLFIIIVCLITGFLIVFFCPTAHVKVKGNHNCPDSTINEAIIRDSFDENAVYCLIHNYLQPVKNIPFVEEYKVSMANRNTLLVEVKEKEPYGYVVSKKGDSYIYYDDAGIVLEVSDRLLEDVFRVVGLSPKKAKIGEVLPLGDSNVKTILLIENEIKKEKLPVDAITFSDDGTISFTINDIFVNLGTRASLSEKLRRLPYILPKLKKQRGTLHLEEWSEENTDIIFERE